MGATITAQALLAATLVLLVFSSSPEDVCDTETRKSPAGGQAMMQMHHARKANNGTFEDLGVKENMREEEEEDDDDGEVVEEPPLSLLAHAFADGATFESARPGSCCTVEPQSSLTWSDFQGRVDFHDNMTRGLPIVVPCGIEVTMDQSVLIEGLQVLGSVKFQEGIDITVQTAFVFVCGRFSIGSPERPHEAKVEIVLTGSTEVTWKEKNFGTAGFVTYGGDLYIRGSACGTTTWGRLKETLVPATRPSLNVALGLGPAARSSSTGHWRYGAAKGVDGGFSPTTQTVLTRTETNPWWYVRIPSLASSGVASVTLSERTRWRVPLSGATVGVASAPCQPGQLCGGTTCQPTVELRQFKASFDCGGAAGEYVYVQLEGDGKTLAVSEVEVFAAGIPEEGDDYSLELQSMAGVAWKQGDKLMIASSGFDPEETEEVTITAVSDGLVHVRGLLEHQHLGCDSSSAQCVMAAEVASMSRNVVIRGEDGCAPQCGHFMIAHTAHGFVCGAEFTNLGRTAVEGRYPVHVHLPGNAPALVVKDNAVHHNHNRGVVMHGVHGMTVESNLVFRTKGHCFMTEDAVEQHNIIKNNVGVLPSALDFGCSATHPSRDPHFLCPQRSEAGGGNAFWMSNPNNYFDGNVGIARGGAFFLETRHVVGATRRLFPAEARQVGHNGQIKGRVPLAQFSNNVAHSSGQGIGNYPRANFPAGGRNAYENFTAWRCGMGVNVHNSKGSRYMPVTGARLIQNHAGARVGSPSGGMDIANTQIAAAPGNPESVPLIAKWFGHTTEAKLVGSFRVDDYTKTWVRCHGNYSGQYFFDMFRGDTSECTN